MQQNGKPELLVPAGSLEVLKTAVNFGADAVYIGGEVFSLRAKARNFSAEDMAEGIKYAHDHGAKVHVTANILAHNADLAGADDYFSELAELGPDALIIADPGMFEKAGRLCPGIDRHISTQANNTNYETFDFWYRQGAKRVVCARELSLAEIHEIREKTPEGLEIEAFVHGAMCISYSGRCLLSNYFTGRDANHGACTHPCRWKYSVMEETRPGEYLPVYENERGTFVFNSKDLCMIEHVPELVAAGIDSWKIEGRMKTALYVATVARTYRKAIDDYFESEEKYRSNLPWYREEIRKCTFRQFTTGFYFGKPSEESMVYDNNTYKQDAVYLGVVRQTDEIAPRTGADNTATAIAPLVATHEETGSGSLAMFEQKNKFSVGDTIEIMKPDGRDVPAIVRSLRTLDGEQVESAPHPQEQLWAELDERAEVGDILRMESDEPAGD